VAVVQYTFTKQTIHRTTQQIHRTALLGLSNTSNYNWDYTLLTKISCSS